MKYCLPLFIIALFSCNQKNKIIADRINNADSAAINFFKGDGSMDSVVLVKIIREKKQLNQLADYISQSAASEKNCGLDGSIHFFKNNMVLQDIDFRMNDANCMHFQLNIGGRRYVTELSDEAKKLLTELKIKK